MELSIVTTLYKSQTFLNVFFHEIISVIESLKIKDYEIIVVNDGSPDNSLEFCLLQQREFPQIKVVDLSRNFGHHYALQAGISVASGDYVYLLDSDLETPPSFLATCYNEIKNNSDIDLIYGVQEGRKGHLLEKIGGDLFYAVFNALSDVKIPKNILTECIMTRAFVNNLLNLKDSNLFLAGMIHWVGLNKKGIAVKKRLRVGESTYTFRKRFQLMIQAVTSFSGRPLEFLFYIGMLVTILSMLYLIYLLISKLILGDAISIGWTSLLGVNLLSLGVISMFLGLIGLYVYRIYKQVQGRPNYIVKMIYN